MTFQNRVTPFGTFVAVSDRGDLMGNRGRLHNDEKQVVRNRDGRKDWVTCALSFNGRKRTVMGPSSYTELFFLDEATALAAGHRPCWTCRRDAFNAFSKAWIDADLPTNNGNFLVKAADPILHADRMNRAGRKVTYRSNAAELQDGTMIELDDAPGIAWLVWRDRLLKWSSGGYLDSTTVPHQTVTVLTPAVTVKVLGAGYPVAVHASATANPAASDQTL